MIDPDEQDRRDRERESKMGEESLQMSDEELLKEIFYCSSSPMTHNSTTTISRTIAYFTSLLVRLSRRAEESTKQNIEMQNKLTNLTRQLLYLTWGLVFLTILYLCVTLFTMK